MDASPKARGVTPDMPLQTAMSRCPKAILIEADIPRYHAVFNHLLDSLEMVSPLVEGSGLGMAYVDLGGLEDLYGGEEALLEALARAALPYYAGIGVGENKFVSYLAALSLPTKESNIPSPSLHLNPLRGERKYISRGEGIIGSRPWKAPGDALAFLHDFPVDVLPLPWQTVERLRSFGLHTLGELARLSPGPLQAQLGPDGLLAWELANGIDRRPLLPRQSEDSIAESLTFAAPVITQEPVLLATEILLNRAFRRPQLQSRNVRAVILEGRVTRGTSFVLRVAFREPAGSAGQAYQLVKLRLANIELSGPLEDLSLTLVGLTGEAGRQESFFSEVRQRNILRATIRQLEVRLGERPPVYQVREVEPWSRIPERRRALVEYAP